MSGERDALVKAVEDADEEYEFAWNCYQAAEERWLRAERVERAATDALAAYDAAHKENVDAR